MVQAGDYAIKNSFVIDCKPLVMDEEVNEPVELRCLREVVERGVKASPAAKALYPSQPGISLPV
jgi:hypothetical protein